VKIWQGVTSKQPNELMPRIAALQLANRFNGVATPHCPLEIADPDSGAAGGPKSRSEAAFERSHVPGTFLEWIAGRDQPPDFVQSKHSQGFAADVPVPAVRRIERSSKKADARHERQLA
jgi:hypothetical protein